MKNIFLSLAFVFSITHVNAQWTIGKPLTIMNNTTLSFNYVIYHHSAFYDGIDDGIINGLYGPFNMNTIYSNSNKDIIFGQICNGETVPPNSLKQYNLPTIGLPVGSYSYHPNSPVTNIADFGLYFRTYYLKGGLASSTIWTPGFAVKYPAPPTAGLTPIAGTTYSYDTSTSMLYETSGVFQSFFFIPPGTVPGTTSGFTIQFTEIGGVEYVICNEI